ncbi:hypothetical protein GOBAR_AA24101 [Gossypium barbadense]|uniref:Uncharacterized protein n=1 Tax=Gossypium barbadense TaxID=3634 RepID=A0A2P5WZR9_GOSBA|nr:hypothetical protein GOBAR_AA24101 [Gossypium barbadense]
MGSLGISASSTTELDMRKIVRHPMARHAARTKGQKSDILSIAAVVSFMKWPLIFSYRASGRTQSLKLEMIDSLFKLVSDKVDEGIELVHAISKKRHRHICCGPYSPSSFGNLTVRAVYRV